MITVNSEKLKAIVDCPIVNNSSSLAYNYLVEIGTTDLEFLKDTIAYKFLLCEGILEEVDNQKKQKL